jgi:hypothetical protein
MPRGNGQDVDILLRSFHQEQFPEIGYDYYGSITVSSSEDLLDLRMGFRVGSLGTPLTASPYHTANAVIDEFAICDFEDDAPSAMDGRDAWALSRYREGRYYKGEGAFNSALMIPEGGHPARLLSVRWTVYLPKEPRSEVVTGPGGGVVGGSHGAFQADPRLEAAAVDLSLLPPAGAERPLRQGAPLSLSLSAFRYLVRFRTNLPFPLNDPVLETPFLDDISFAWQPATGPRMLTWEHP